MLYNVPSYVNIAWEFFTALSFLKAVKSAGEDKVFLREGKRAWVLEHSFGIFGLCVCLVRMANVCGIGGLRKFSLFDFICIYDNHCH